jgi:hypothetical protein
VRGGIFKGMGDIVVLREKEINNRKKMGGVRGHPFFIDFFRVFLR